MSTDGPIQRLSRYDGVEFHEVGLDELAMHPAEPDDGRQASHVVHVFAHGWQPGYRLRERLLATADAVALLPAWDRRLVDSRGRALIEDYVEVLDALAALDAPSSRHTVLWYSWLDEAATDADVFQAHRSRQATQVNGRRLALALHQCGATVRGTRLHLIGHSHGSAVVTHAAAALTRPPDQLTLLDAPEDPISRVGGASDLIDVVLPRLTPGRGPGQTFVESYASAFGRPYHRRPGLSEVVDVQLGAPLTRTRDPVRMINAAHLYPVQWYARSVREVGRGVGYGWSPLTGADPSALYSWYAAGLPQFPLAVRRHVADPITRFGEALAERFVDRTPSVARRAARRETPHRRPVDDVRLALDGQGATAAVVVTERGDELIEFDLALHACSGDELIEIDLDGAPAFTAQAAFRVPRSGRYLMLGDGRVGEHLVTLRFAGGGASAAAASVQNLRLVSAGRGAPVFTVARSAATIFAAGAVAGAGATLAGVLGLHYLAKRLRPAMITVSPSNVRGIVSESTAQR